RCRRGYSPRIVGSHAVAESAPQIAPSSLLWKRRPLVDSAATAEWCARPRWSKNTAITARRSNVGRAAVIADLRGDLNYLALLCVADNRPTSTYLRAQTHHSSPARMPPATSWTIAESNAEAR